MSSSDLYRVLTDNFYIVYGHEVFFNFCKYMKLKENVDQKLTAEVCYPGAMEMYFIVEPGSITIHTCGNVYSFLELKDALDTAILNRWYERNTHVQQYVHEVSKQFFGVR